MTYSSLQAGKTLCEISGWQMTNLRLQKILYFAHMYFLGIYKRPLIKEEFEAWDYGPVELQLYRHVKMYGKESIGKSAFTFVEAIPSDKPEYKMLEDLFKVTEKKRNRELINISHWKQGAWYKYYDPDVPHVRIPNEGVEREYAAREAIRKKRNL